MRRALLRPAGALLLLALAAACNGPTEPDASEERLVPSLEHGSTPLGLGLESFVELRLEPGKDSAGPRRFLDSAALSLSLEGGAQLLWTETQPEGPEQPFVYRVHFRCGVDAAAAQRLHVRLDFPQGADLESSVELPCVEATGLTLHAPAHLVPGEQFIARVELLAGNRQVLGRGITFAEPAGPLLALPAAAREDFLVRAVRPGAQPRLRAGPLEVSVPVTVHAPDTLAFSLVAHDHYYERSAGVVFRGVLHTAQGEEVQAARGCEVTVSPPSAVLPLAYAGRCEVYTQRSALEVCMTYGAQRRCEPFTP